MIRYASSLRPVAFLYHLCARDLRGTVLYPLNGLRDAHPDVYERERRKFTGRERVLEYVVPHLGVPWGDTVNLSALDPRALVAARRRLGVPFSHLLERRLVRIPVARVAGIPAVRYQATVHWLNSRPGDEAALDAPLDEEFSPFDPETFEEAREVPQRHLDYLVEQRDRGEPALGFVFVPHVLVAGPVDVGGLELVDL